MQIKVKVLAHQKKLLSRLSHWAPLNSFIKFYYGLKVIAEFLRIY